MNVSAAESPEHSDWFGKISKVVGILLNDHMFLYRKLPPPKIKLLPIINVKGVR